MANIWPSPPIIVTDEVKHLITRFFDISDSIDPHSGRSFAEQLFTKDGFFKTHKTCIFNGHDGTSLSPSFYTPIPKSHTLGTEIASSRSGMSPILAYRKHHFTKIYANNSPTTDLAVLGRFEIGFKTGSVLDLEFTARFVVDAEVGRLKSVEVFSDGGQSKQAFEEAMRVWEESKKGD